MPYWGCPGWGACLTTQVLTSRSQLQQLGCARSCPWRPLKPQRGIQLWPAHTGLSAGQSAGCLYDHGRLASSPAGGSNSEFDHYQTVGWNPGMMTVQTDRSSWTQPVLAWMKSPPTMKKVSYIGGPGPGSLRRPSFSVFCQLHTKKLP